MAEGAGAASSVSLGMAVFGGMLVGTIGMTLLTPVYFLVIQGIAEKFGGPPEFKELPDEAKEESDPAPDPSV